MLRHAHRALAPLCLSFAFLLSSLAPAAIPSPPETDTGSPPAFAIGPDEFVTREGTRLAIQGRSFYFSGANQYYIFYKSKAMIDEVLEDAARMGLTVLRTWAFSDGQTHDGHSLQPRPREYDESGFENLDYAIYRARQLGIRLIFTLVNNWDAFGGMNAYVNWSPTAQSHDDFYSDPETRAIFRDYIRYVLNRKNSYTQVAYKDEPAILLWELANEPRIERGRASELYAWIDEMAGLIKSIDSRHLVSTGSEGDYSTDFVMTHASPHIDLASFHLYPEDWGMPDEAVNHYIRRQAEMAKEELQKPVYCGEFGERSKGTRDSTYARWYKAFRTHSIDGALFWLLSGRQDDGSLYPDYDGFTVYYPESSSTLAVIESFTRSAEERSKRLLDLTAPLLSALKPREPLKGVATLRGSAADQKGLREVSLNFGGGYRPASGLQNWSYTWDTRQMLDGVYTIEVRAMDLEGNISHETLQVTVDNVPGQPRDWELLGFKQQDDGYNYVYEMQARYLGEEIAEGNFAFRFYLTLDGALKLGAHYETSQVWKRDPVLSGPHAAFGKVVYFDLDLGARRLQTGENIGYRGHFTQADGQMKSRNDWSAADLNPVLASVSRVVLLKNGEPVAGFAP